MKKTNFIAVLLGAIFASAIVCPAQPVAPEKPVVSENKQTRQILSELQLNNADKEAKVRMILMDHAQAQKNWHEKNGAQIKELWNMFNQARSKTNQAAADAALDKLAMVYAGFKPEHDEFIAKLGKELSPEQVETVKDAMTINKVKVTYNAYQQIFHGLTAEQNAFILKNLKAAREEAMDAAEIKKEGSAFFKEYKIKIEAYLTAQGYDVKQSYVEFVARQNAEKAAKKSPASSDSKPGETPKEKE